MRLHSTAQAQLAFDQVIVDIPSKVDVPGKVDISGKPIKRIYLTWQPIKATARCRSSGEKKVTLRNAGKAGGGTLAFGDAGQIRQKANKARLDLTLPADGSPVEFWIGGATASSEDLDAVLEVTEAGGKAVLATFPMMVRVRKDALALTMSERFRFLRALAKMNANISAPYARMRFVHIGGMEREAHSNPAFLPWHRAYMLDFERELQGIDPSVALPYWRFNNPAPALFGKYFLGADGDGKFVEFYARNPLYGWTFNGRAGITRSSSWWWWGSHPATEGAGVVDEPAITDTGPATFDEFRDMEIDPHNEAHVSWHGDISAVPSAALDPLFFLLHANIDRLWASWQSKGRPVRINPFHSTAFSAIQHLSEDEPPRIGHHADETMWPWNGATAYPRPTIANTVGAMCPSPITPNAPPAAPLVGDLIDYQGVLTNKHLGFDYDNIPFPKDP